MPAMDQALGTVGAGTVRVALVADTHGHLDARVADTVATCDLAVHAGDIGGVAVLQRLQALTGRVVAVTGNNDRLQQWPAEAHDALATLHRVERLDLPGGTLAIVHGDRWRARDRHACLRAAFPQARGIVYGHSHRLICDTGLSPWVLNPGAAGRTRTYGGPSCLVLTASEEAWTVRAHRFPLPFQVTAKGIVEDG